MDKEIVVLDTKDIELVHESIGRTGAIFAKLFPTPTGVPGVEMDFNWGIFTKGYGTPRHRHTFDQIRFVVKGKFQAAQGDVEAGECGYYPEGVHYGPQLQDDDCTMLILQFPGPSAIRYLPHRKLDEARQKLIAEGGKFENGVYTKFTEDGRKINKDSHAACFEAITGQKMEFPEGRFPGPVFMKTAAYSWVPDRKLSGVEHKHFGTFGERRTGMGLVRLAPGASLPAHVQEDAAIMYLIEGTMRYDGKTWTGGITRDEGTYMFFPHDMQVGEIASETGGTFFKISLPMLADIEAEQRMGRLQPLGRAAAE
jgi:quercetin dioxygenase-like cupin family protein